MFGSVARREERADSNVDFLVELVPEHELNCHICEQVMRKVVEL